MLRPSPTRAPLPLVPERAPRLPHQLEHPGRLLRQVRLAPADERRGERAPGFIWVHPEGELAVGFLDILRGGRGGDALG